MDREMMKMKRNEVIELVATILDKYWQEADIGECYYYSKDDGTVRGFTVVDKDGEEHDFE